MGKEVKTRKLPCLKWIKFQDRYIKLSAELVEGGRLSHTDLSQLSDPSSTLQQNIIMVCPN